ncbi:envelope glycoprotein isoform X1 [Carex rostrata]
MASIGRSASAIKAFRAVARGAALPKPSVPLRSFPFVRRSVVSALGSVESLMPLHSAIASARLRSIIASDSSYWSCLSQGLSKRI